MRFKITRSSLQRALLLGGPLAFSIHCDAPDDNDRSYGNEIVIQVEPTGELVDAINECLLDEAACFDLCDQLLVANGYSSQPGGAEIYECNVSKQTDGVEAEIWYSAYPIAVGCGVVMVDPETEPTSIGAHYAALAELESTSVYAFAQLARDLRRHGAPPSLVRAASRAVIDEARHTAQASMLARAWGSKPRPLRPSRPGDRDLFALSLENAVDGRVHETFGAEVAAHQARAATDPFIRSTMKSIARDELRHAELAVAVDRWVRPQLSAAQRRTLERSARAAAADLAASQTDVPASVSDLAGFPSAARARALALELEAKRRS